MDTKKNGVTDNFEYLCIGRRRKSLIVRVPGKGGGGGKRMRTRESFANCALAELVSGCLHGVPERLNLPAEEQKSFFHSASY